MSRLVTRSLAHRIPLQVHIDVTYRCNEKCVHCYLDHSGHDELTTAEIRNILTELADAGALFLTFSGGEIFLRPDFFELLAFARRLGFDISLKSNALLITEQRAAQLKELGVRKIQISLYSTDPAVHDAITRVPGSLERTLLALHFCRAQGLRVQISCPLMKQNIATWRGVQALADSLGITFIMDPTVTPMMDGTAGPVSLRVTPQELLPLLSEPVFQPPAAQAPAEPSTVDAWDAAYHSIPCSAGHNSVYISPRGDVFPCVQMPLPAGNLRRQSFAEIWRGSPALNRVRAVRESDLEICSQCEIRAFCQRCPGLAFMEDGDFARPSLRACELAEAAARLAGVAHPVSALRDLGPAEPLPPPAVSHLVQIQSIAPSEERKCSCQ